MTDRTDILLNSQTSKRAIDQDIRLKQEFLHTNRPLPVDELVKVVDVSEVFSSERDISNCYRFIGNINVVASNVLFNWDGSKSYEIIESIRNYIPSTGNYQFTQEQILLEEDGWFYYLTGESIATNCNRNYLEPVQDRFALYNVSGERNWNLWLTYPAAVNEVDLKFNGISITSGIAIYSGTTVLVDDRIMTAFICSINHGLVVGDEISITGGTLTGYEGIHNIYKLGFGDGNYTSTVFIVDVNLGTPPSFIGTLTSFKRIVENIVSQYNSRWFKKISKLSEIETFNTAFATNIYKDQIYSYSFNKDYDITLIDDYLGRPLTEVYISLVKNQDYDTDDGSPFWTLVESGLKTILETSEYDINTLNTTITGDSIENDLNNSSDLIFGDITEYNPANQTETVLEIAYHRFNTTNREDNNFLEGYYYKPHYKKQIRKFSDYVEFAFSGESIVPYYATTFSDGRVTWRDIIPNDFANGTAIPFFNGCHYIYNSFNVLIQRQDPCNLFDLGNVSLVLGNCDTDEQFNEVVELDVCE